MKPVRFLLLLFISYSGYAQSHFEENTITKEGAWCWFADPRALHYENPAGRINSTFIGCIDVHGSIKATQWNHLTNTVNEVLVRSRFQPDDHDCPSFLVLPDERIMIFYSRHTDEKCFYYRISKKPGDITMLGEEKKIPTADNTTYPSPFILSGDPTHIYLCWRGIKWHPTIAQLSLPDADDNVSFTWGPYQIVNYNAANARPYAKYASNGKDKIYMTFTTTHPDNQVPNYVYFAYIDINTKELKEVTGAVITDIATGPHDINSTAQYTSRYPNVVVDDDAQSRDWIWEVSPDSAGVPVIAMVRISSDKTSHDYYYAKWTGTSWRKTFLTNAGGAFHQTPGIEMCYSGGMSLNKENPNQIFCSVPVTGTYGKVYEIIKYTVDDAGGVTEEMITNNSKKNNVRPFSIPGSENSSLKSVWMTGDYYYWTVDSLRPLGFPTAITGNVKLP